MKKLILSFISIILILSIVSCSDTDSNTEDTSPSTVEIPSYPHSDMTLTPPDKVIASVDGIDITAFALRYFFVSAYRDFYQTHYSELSSYFDPSIPLHDQVPNHSDYKNYATWYDYFLEIAKRDLEYYIAFASNAKKEGISLTAEEKASVDESVAQLEENASSYDISFSEYMDEFEMMGPGVTPQIIKDVYYIFQLATKYSKIKYDSFEITSGEIDAEYQKDKNAYSTVDYDVITIVPKYDATSTDAEKEAAKKQALEDADKFISYIEDGNSYFEAHKLLYPEMTDEEHTEFLNSCSMTDVTYTKDNELSEWLFASERAPAEINKTVDTQGRIKIVQIVKTASKIDYNIPNIRYIYIDLSLQHYNEVTAPQLAKDIIEQVKNAENKDEKFKELVALHSNDTTTNQTGGLIENVIPTSTMLPPDVISWCFEEDRELFDCDFHEYESYGVVCGYFITFISSHGRPYYEYVIETKLKGDKLSDFIENITRDIKVEYDSTAIDSIYK